MKTLTIDIPVFKCVIYVVTGCTWEEYAKHMKKKWGIDDDFSYLKMCDGTAQKFDGEPYRAIWLKDFDGRPYDCGTLAHEAVHAVIRLCEDKGVPIYSNNTADETMAYLVDYIVSTVHEKHRKKRK